MRSYEWLTLNRQIKMTNKPFCQAPENNKHPIIEVLTTVFSTNKHIIEIGSGTGQHGVFFAQHLPHLIWQTSDLPINHSGINQWLDDCSLTNIKKPITIDLNEEWSFPDNTLQVDGIFTANTLHIIDPSLVTKFFEGIARHLKQGANVCIYGPFKYQGKFTSESNANFDVWLKDINKEYGIRNIEDILSFASSANLTLINDYSMPANNQLLFFKKTR